jgi:CarD family transcriptional regulator
MEFEVGDKVVYSPHGAGMVTAVDERNGERFLAITIAHSNLTLTVSAAMAKNKGVRHVVDAASAEALVAVLEGEPQPLQTDAQARARQAADTHKRGQAAGLADLLRDYRGLTMSGARMTAAEQRTYSATTAMLASEIALATDVDYDAAVERVERALGIDA